jgi:hypothetical protein
MELDVSILIKNATIDDLQRLFGKQDISSIYQVQTAIAPLEKKVIMASVPVEDHREENLARSILPGDELKSKKEVGNRYHQKWDIPFDSMTESAKYEVARKLCKRFNKPYLEALKLAEAAGNKKERKAAPNKWQIPFSSKTQPHEYHLAWTLCRKYNLPYPDAFKRQEEEKTGVIVQGAAENVVKRSETVPSDLIVTGIDVRQIKPYKGKQFFGTARVSSRDGDLVTVKNGKGKKHTIDVKFLEIATGPGKTEVEKKVPISVLEKPQTDTKVEKSLQDNDPIVEKNKDTPKEKPKPEKLLSNLNLHWSDAEMLVIQDLPDWRDAVAAYRKAIPDSKRTNNSIKQQWKKIAAGVVKKRRGPEKKSDEVMPPKPFPSPTAKTPATVPPASQKSVTDFTIGTHVKQVKPYLDRQVSGVGIVTGHKQGLVEVNFSGHQYYKIDLSCLESL